MKKYRTHVSVEEYIEDGDKFIRIWSAEFVCNSDLERVKIALKRFLKTFNEEAFL